LLCRYRGFNGLFDLITMSITYPGNPGNLRITPGTLDGVRVDRSRGLESQEAQVERVIISNLNNVRPKAFVGLSFEGKANNPINHLKVLHMK